MGQRYTLAYLEAISRGAKTLQFAGSIVLQSKAIFSGWLGPKTTTYVTSRSCISRVFESGKRRHEAHVPRGESNYYCRRPSDDATAAISNTGDASRRKCSRS